MKILVCSCDRNTDLFYPFYKCMEKYYPGHPEVIYSTETMVNPYYRTIFRNYPLDQWSRRIRETLSVIKDDHVLVMVDDAFIRAPVDKKRIDYAERSLVDNVACVNFERQYDSLNDDTPWTSITGFRKRRPGAPWCVSIQCGLWDRKKFIDVLRDDMDPWEIEMYQPTRGYTYLINSGDYIIDYGYRNMQYMGIHNGRWCREIVPFFEKEGIEVDYSERGFN